MTAEAPTPDNAPAPPPKRRRKRPPKSPQYGAYSADGRTRVARHQRALQIAFVGQLGDVPYSRLPVMVRAAVDAAVSLTMALDRLRAEQASGQPVDPDTVTRTAGALGRALEALGLDAAGIERRRAAARQALIDAAAERSRTR